MEEQVFLKQLKGWLRGFVTLSRTLPAMGVVLESQCQMHATNIPPRSLCPASVTSRLKVSVEGCGQSLTL